MTDSLGTEYFVEIKEVSKIMTKNVLILEKKETDKTLIRRRENTLVLLMDDEEDIRIVTGEILKHLGYKVVVTKDGDEAIEVYKKAKKFEDPFDVVILDLVIPGRMGGKETIQKLISIDPEVKAIVSSGYSNDSIMADFRKYGFSEVITKPFEVEELSQTLDEIIGNR